MIYILWRFVGKKRGKRWSETYFTLPPLARLIIAAGFLKDDTSSYQTVPRFMADILWILNVSRINILIQGNIVKSSVTRLIILYWLECLHALTWIYESVFMWGVVGGLNFRTFFSVSDWCSSRMILQADQSCSRTTPSCNFALDLKVAKLGRRMVI